MPLTIRRRSRLQVETMEVRALLSTAGALDPSFGGGSGSRAFPLGVTYTYGGVSQAQVGGVVVQQDGKIVEGGIVVIGQTSSLTLTRFNANGSIDTTFGAGGQMEVPISSLDGTFSYGSGVPISLLLQEDGKIVEVGSANIATTTATFVAIRVNPDGTLDSTFGTQGVAEYPASVTSTRIGKVMASVIQPDGKIVLAGSVSGNFEFAAVRLNTDGTIDTSYGTNGIAVVPITINGVSFASVTGAAIQTDGKVVLAGSAANSYFNSMAGKSPSYGDLAVVRLNTDGTLDTAFGGTAAGGKVLLPANPANPTAQVDDVGGKLAIQPDGKILVTGTDTQGNLFAGALYRLNPDGSPDATFGTNGLATLSIFPSPDNSVAVQSDGKILVGGLSSGSVVLRLNANGSPDVTFGNTTTPGQTLLPSHVAGTHVNVAIQADGGILVGGSSLTPSISGPVGGFGVARILSQENSQAANVLPPTVPPANFDGSIQTNLSVYLPSLGAFAYRPVINEQLSGVPDTIIPFGIPGAGQTIPAPADYGGTQQTEIAAYLPALGDYAIRPASGAPDQLIPFGIPGAGQSIPAPGDYEGTGRADIAVYMPALGAFGIRPSTGGPDEIIAFGIPGAGQTIPTPGDYFGTGQDDIAAYLPAIGAFALRNPAGGADQIIPFGIAGAGQSIPAPGDYDGSGKTELAVYLPKYGLFAYRPANGGPDVIEGFGTPNDGTIPAPGDYDGVGHTEIAIYDPTVGFFAYRPAGGKADVIELFGIPGAGQSLPLATQPGALSVGLGGVFASSVSKMSVDSVGVISSGEVHSASITTGSVVPGGPALTIRRVARLPVAQAIPNPQKMFS